jgi:hypothetical protein
MKLLVDLFQGAGRGKEAAKATDPQIKASASKMTIRIGLPSRSVLLRPSKDG